MASSLPPFIEDYQKAIDELTVIQQELSRIKMSLRAHIQHAMRTPVRRTSEEEVFYQITRLVEPSATDIHNYVKWIDRATIISILEKLMASGQIRQRKTRHTTRYRIAQD